MQHDSLILCICVYVVAVSIVAAHLEIDYAAHAMCWLSYTLTVLFVVRVLCDDDEKAVCEVYALVDYTKLAGN